MERRRGLALVFVLLTTAVYGLSILFDTLPGAAAIHGAGGTAGCVFAALGCGWAALRRSDRSRRGWAAISGGLAMWALGNGLSFGYDLFDTDGYSRLVDIIYLCAIPVLLFGLASLLVAQLPQVGPRLLLDGLIIAGSLFAVSWSTVLGSVVSTHQSVVNWLIALAYPLTDVMMASVVLLVLGASAPGSRASLGWLSAGFLVTAAADVAYAMLDQAGQYAASDDVDAAWYLSYGFMLLGGVWAATEPVVEIQRAEAPRYPFLPYIPLSLAIGTTLIAYVGTGHAGPVTVFTSATLIVLVLGRQLLTISENNALNARLNATVAELRLREDELRHRAYHDALTELPNRALFHSRVEAALDDGVPVTVLYVDLDGFKLVNDQLGHSVGDALLRIVADRLKACAGPDRTVARLGGDEFAILLPDAAGSSPGTDLAACIVDSIGAITTVDDHPVTIGASVGVAVNQIGGRLGELMRAADMAMYAAKLDGKGRYAVVDQPAAESSATPDERRARAHQIETLVGVAANRR